MRTRSVRPPFRLRLGSPRSPSLRCLPPQGGKEILATLVFVLSFAASAHAVELTGHLTQGGLAVGKVEPGAQVLLGDTPVLVGKDGLFVIGFGRDQAAHAQLTIIHAGGKGEQQVLTIAQRKFDIQRIDNMDHSKVTPDETNLARIKAEQDQVNATRTNPSDVRDFLVPFIWPAKGPISGVYGSQRILNGEPRAPHYGLDIAAPEGAPIVAPAPGIVRLVAPDFFLTGGTVILDHGFGVQSAFIHMSKVEVKDGQVLKQGDLIGHVGRTGRATGPHLHWGMTWGTVRLDPQLWVPAGGNES
jgi:murein DD-endopeptidase MepM/ murein hydrolase activator NlpD